MIFRCSVNETAAEAVVFSCTLNSGLTEKKMAEFKQGGCECLRDAFGMKADVMTCEPSKKNGVYHPWNGGHKNWHQGSHIK